MSEPVILLVDDDDCFRRAMAIALRLDGYRVLEAANGDEAVRQVLSVQVELAVVDMLLGSEFGNDVIERIACAAPETRLASMSGHPGVVSAAARAGRAVHLEKPFGAAEIAALLRPADSRSPALVAARAAGRR